MASVTKKVLGISIFFAVLPLIISGYYFYLGSQSLTSFTITGFDHLINDSGSYSDEFIAFFTEEFVKQRALLTSKTLQHHLLVNHPGVLLESLTGDPTVRQVALSNVGRQGYTSVHSRDGVVLFHPDPSLVGTNLSIFSSQLPRYWQLANQSFSEDANGQYDWRDPDGVIQPYHMYCAPVDTYVSCAHIPIAELDETGSYLKGLIESDKQNTVSAIERGLVFLQFQLFIILIVLLIAAIISIMILVRKTISSPAQKLLFFVSKITTGNYDYPHGIKSNDEFGRLAYTIHGLAQVLKRYKQDSANIPNANSKGDVSLNNKDLKIKKSSKQVTDVPSDPGPISPPIERNNDAPSESSDKSSKSKKVKTLTKTASKTTFSNSSQKDGDLVDSDSPDDGATSPEMVRVGERTRREYL